MKITTKGRYSLRVLLYLAENYNNTCIPLVSIAEAEDISLKYLEHIMKNLVQTNLVTSYRGSHGGYKLANPPYSYTLGTILKSTETDIYIADCLNTCGPLCPNHDKCSTIEIWEMLQTTIEEILDNLTLVDLLRIQERKTGHPSKYLTIIKNI